MKRNVLDGEPEKLAKLLASLGGLDGQRLKEHWRSLHGAELPARLSRSMLVQAIAYRLQEKAFGGLKPTTRRLLQRVATEGAARRATNTTSAHRVRPGVVLLREWHGATHQVTVLTDGVRFRGQRYRSLSAVARAITGSRWSGPLFFGLKSTAKERDHGAP